MTIRTISEEQFSRIKECIVYELDGHRALYQRLLQSDQLVLVGESCIRTIVDECVLGTGTYTELWLFDNQITDDIPEHLKSGSGIASFNWGYIFGDSEPDTRMMFTGEQAAYIKESSKDIHKVRSL